MARGGMKNFLQISKRGCIETLGDWNVEREGVSLETEFGHNTNVAARIRLHQQHIQAPAREMVGERQAGGGVKKRKNIEMESIKT